MIYQQQKREPVISYSTYREGYQLVDVELERLESLRDWEIQIAGKCGLRLAYRVGIINNFYDGMDGNRTLILFPYASLSGFNIVKEERSNPVILSTLHSVMKRRAMDASREKDITGVITIPCWPPEFMLEELDFMLGPGR